MTEGSLVAFIGWLRLERDRNGRKAGAASLPQYLSAVRQMQLVLTGEQVPPYPFLNHVIRAYKKWEEEQHPSEEIRCGIPADSVQAIWALGMQSTSSMEVRDCCACVFAYCFNGLRESSVMSLLESQVTLTDDQVVARLSVVKGRQASREQLVSYDRISTLASPLDLLARWASIRRPHFRFFALPGEPVEWTKGSLTTGLQRVLKNLNLQPPPTANLLLIRYESGRTPSRFY